MRSIMLIAYELEMQTGMERAVNTGWATPHTTAMSGSFPAEDPLLGAAADADDDDVLGQGDAASVGKKKKKKGKKGFSAPVARVEVDLNALPPRERAMQVDMLKLAECMGLREPPPPPPHATADAQAPLPEAGAESDAGSKSSKKKGKGKKGKGKKGAKAKAPGPPAPNAFSLSAMITHVDLPEVRCV